LANVYLHHVFDLWVDWWRRTLARGDVVTVRFADDFVVGFEYEEDARRFRTSCADGSQGSGWSCIRTRRG
jgi:hypothetical protein